MHAVFSFLDRYAQIIGRGGMQSLLKPISEHKLPCVSRDPPWPERISQGKAIKMHVEEVTFTSVFFVLKERFVCQFAFIN